MQVLAIVCAARVKNKRARYAQTLKQVCSLSIGYLNLYKRIIKRTRNCDDLVLIKLEDPFLKLE